MITEIWKFKKETPEHVLAEIKSRCQKYHEFINGSIKMQEIGQTTVIFQCDLSKGENPQIITTGYSHLLGDRLVLKYAEEIRLKTQDMFDPFPAGLDKYGYYITEKAARLYVHVNNYFGDYKWLLYQCNFYMKIYPKFPKDHSVIIAAENLLCFSNFSIEGLNNLMKWIGADYDYWRHAPSAIMHKQKENNEKGCEA